MQAGSRKLSPKENADRPSRIDCLVDARAELAQGLAWDERTHRLFWVDTPTGTLLSVSLTSGFVQSWSLPCPLGTIALCDDGRILAVLIDGIYLFDLTTHDLHFLAPLDAPWAGDRLDGDVRADGAFWLGGTASAAGPMLRVGPDGLTTRVAMDSYSGAVDAEGAYWTCDTPGGAVCRFAADGRSLGRIALRVPAPTMCCFGGTDMRTLFIASRRAGLTARTLQKSPAAGGIFMVRVRVPGVAGRMFAPR